MHLFLYSIIPEIDTLAPIIDSIKDKNKVIIRSVNVINTYSDHPIFKLLKDKNINLSNKPILNIKGTLAFILMKIINSLPIFIQDKLIILITYFFYNIVPFNKNYLSIFLKKNKIQSITIDDGCREKIINIIYQAASEMDIPIIMHQVGLFIIKTKQIIINEKISYYHSKYNFEERPKFIKNKKTKLIFLGFPRFTSFWINKLKDISQIKRNELENNNLLNVSLFTRPRKKILDKNNQIISKIKKIENVRLKVKNKPRHIMTNKQENKHFDKFTSSEIIDWSDVIITHNTSIIAEMLLKQKPIFFLDYLSPPDEYYYILKYKCINIIKSEEELLNLIISIKNDKSLLKEYIHDSSKYFSELVHDDLDDKTVYKNYSEFYLNLNK